MEKWIEIECKLDEDYDGFKIEQNKNKIKVTFISENVFVEETLLDLFFLNNTKVLGKFEEIFVAEKYWYQNGFDVLLSTYRGTASSVGKLKHENDLFSDARHWYNFSKSQFSEDEIILVGSGFGGSIAAQLSGSQNPKALILENPHFSYGDYQSKKRFWWLPYSYFTSFDLNTWEYLRRTTCAIILIQDENKKGKKDCLTSFLKEPDKAYWLENKEEVSYSFQSDKVLFFDEILRDLIVPTKPKQSSILKTQ